MALVKMADKINEQFLARVKTKIEKFTVLAHGSQNSQIVICKIKKGLDISPEENALLIRYLKIKLGKDAKVAILKHEKVNDLAILTLLLSDFDRNGLHQISRELEAP
ncbi:MAG: hypothetical protein NTX00_00920 [Candidatus Parcubacteria bacterium]|nr:hypothetical protein [Candidatus Parcubacteria bacterium]